MELREYWRIIRRKWWIPVALIALVALFSAVQLRPWQQVDPTYSASMRMLVGVLPATDDETVAAYDPRYYAWLTSEYLVDDFTEVVRSELFAANVSQRLADQAIQVPAGVIQGSAATGKQHRIITLHFNWGDAEELEAIARAAATELIENTDEYFQQLGTPGAGITMLDGPSVGPVGPDLRSRVELPIRLAIALLIGIGFVLLLDYMDPSVRDLRDLEELGIPILGTIPRHR